MAPYLAVAAVIACAAAWLLFAGPRLARRKRVIALVCLAVVDLLVFTANQSSLAPVRVGELGPPHQLERELARAVGANGRFLVVDHFRVGGVELNDIGAPNLNVFTKIPSVQGYGSLTWGAYADATGTHGQNRAAPAAFATDVFDSLDVRALLVLPWAFRTDVTPANPGLVSLAASAPTTRYFGGTVDVTSIEISTNFGGARSVLGSEARAIRLLGAQGRHAPSRVVVATNRATAYFGRGSRASGSPSPAPAAVRPRSRWR